MARVQDSVLRRYHDLDHVGVDEPKVYDLHDAKSVKILDNEITCIVIEFKTNQVDGKGRILRLRVPGDFENPVEEAKTWARTLSFMITKASKEEDEDPAERSTCS